MVASDEFKRALFSPPYNHSVEVGKFLYGMYQTMDLSTIVT